MLCNCIFHIVDIHVLQSILCSGLVACRVDSRDISVITMTNCDYTAGVVNLSEIISVGILCTSFTVYYSNGLLWTSYALQQLLRYLLKSCVTSSVLGSVISVRCCNRLNILYIVLQSYVSVLYTRSSLCPVTCIVPRMLFCATRAQPLGVRTPQNLDGPPQLF